MEEKISIIVPVYNSEKTLERCVRSLMGQSYENIEIILVNDGSKDCSLALCRQFAEEDARIRVIDKPNGGVSSARNAGLDIAQGDFIMFCDSDDWAAKDWCRTLYQAYTREMLVMCGYFIETEQNPNPVEVKVETKVERYPKSDFFRFYQKGFNPPWNKIYSRQVIDKWELRFDERIRNGEDSVFNLRYLGVIKGEILYLGTCQMHYSQPTENNLSLRLDLEDMERNSLLFWEEQKAICRFMDPIQLSREYYNPFFWRYEGIIEKIIQSGKSDRENRILLRKLLNNEAYQTVVERALDRSELYAQVCRCKCPTCLLLWKKLSKLRHRGDPE